MFLIFIYLFRVGRALYISYLTTELTWLLQNMACKVAALTHAVSVLYIFYAQRSVSHFTQVTHEGKCVDSLLWSLLIIDYIYTMQ